ncbi:MAG: AraC family transcriptional regulator [Suilimivivens sp.]
MPGKEIAMQDKITFIPANGLPISGENGEVGYPVQLFYIELMNLPMHRIRWHWHTEIEIIIVEQGEAVFLSDDSKVHLTKGQGILINQNVMHAVHTIDDDTECSLYSLKFHPSFLFGYGSTMMSGKYLVPILSSPAMRIVELLGQDSWHEKLMDIVHNIMAVNLAEKYGYELITKACLCQLWSLLLEQVVPQNIDKARQTTVSLDESRVKEAILYLEEHYREHITLDELASSIHISKSECCRCFKRTLQITPFEYLMRYRIFCAAKMLQKDEPEARSISSLAFSTGFNNVSYFNKVFKQFLHCTPSEYKRSLKTDPTKETGSVHDLLL